MTSEQMLSISEQPHMSCDEINKYIKHLGWGLEYIQYIAKCETLDLAIESANDAESELNFLEDGFEYCRNQCEEIRRWGQEWKDLAKSLTAEFKECKNDFMERAKGHS